MKNVTKLLLSECINIINTGSVIETYINRDDTLETLTKRVNENNVKNSSYYQKVNSISIKLNAILLDLDEQK